MKKAIYHLPGLFEFYDLYSIYLSLYESHPEYFYEWCQIGSIYGSPADCLWGGGRAGYGDNSPKKVLALMQKHGISARLTFSNSLLKEEHLSDKTCNRLCSIFDNNNQPSSKAVKNGIIITSELLLDYIKEHYPNLYLVSSTTKVLTDFTDFEAELARDDFSYVVPDFRLNKAFAKMETLPKAYKDKTEFLCNECCSISCQDRKACYETVSRDNLGLETTGHYCKQLDENMGYSFARAMTSPAFISIEDILDVYLPMGFSNFKIEGRSLGSAMVLEFLLYYMVKPQYQIHVREAIYLDSALDLF